MSSATDTDKPQPIGLRFLGEGFREVDQAMLLEGHTDKEIAQRFGVSVGTV